MVTRGATQTGHGHTAVQNALPSRAAKPLPAVRKALCALRYTLKTKALPLASPGGRLNRGSRALRRIMVKNQHSASKLSSSLRAQVEPPSTAGWGGPSGATRSPTSGRRPSVLPPHASGSGLSRFLSFSKLGPPPPHLNPALFFKLLLTGPPQPPLLLKAAAARCNPRGTPRPLPFAAATASEEPATGSRDGGERGAGSALKGPHPFTDASLNPFQSWQGVCKEKVTQR